MRRSVMLLTVLAESGYTPVNAEAVTAFAAMTVQPSDARKLLYDNFISALKTASIWTKIDAVYLLAAHDSQAALLNLKSPGTHNATLVNAPTFVADQGFTSDGSTSYINTNFNPGDGGTYNYLLNSAHISARSRTNAAVNGTVPIGAYATTTSQRTGFNPRSAAGTFAYGINGGTLATGAAVANSVGLFLVNRSASNAIQSYKDGAASDTGTGAAGAVGNRNFFLLCENQNGTPGAFTTRQIPSASIGGSFDSTEQAAYHAAELAYMQGVGAA